MTARDRRIIWVAVFFYVFWGGQTLWMAAKPDPCHYMKPWLCEP